MTPAPQPPGPPAPRAPTGAKPIMEVRGVTLAYGKRVIQRDLNFDIHAGEVLVLMGPSGCGKSTLLKHLIGLLPPTAGDIRFAGESLVQVEPRRRTEIQRRFGVLYQTGALWSSLTLLENVSLPLQEFTRLAPAEIHALAQYKLALVGLSGFEDFYPSEISGGMRKRAGLARALALDPEIVFFDEPSAGLDPISSRRLDDLILELRDSLGATIVLVTHELSSLFTVGERALYLDTVERTITAMGRPQDLLLHPPNERVHAFLTRNRSKMGGAPHPQI